MWKNQLPTSGQFLSTISQISTRLSGLIPKTFYNVFVDTSNLTDWLIGDSLLRGVDSEILPEKIISDYKELIECALQAAQMVSISSIPPVLNNSERQGIADQLNAALSVLCEETGVTFVNHDNNILDWLITQSMT